MNIFEKMSAITAEISAVAKNLDVGYGKSSYKAVCEADVLAAVKPIEAKHSVYSYPYSRRVIDSGTMTNITTDRNGNTSEKKQMYLRIETVYRFVNTEKPNEYLDIMTYGDGVDSQDKAPGKAMTYGDKYALLKAYKIITGEDPDQNYSGELVGRQETVPAYPQEATPAYPPREEMLSVIGKKYPDGSKNRTALLSALKVGSIEAMSEAQVIAVYNKCVAK